MKPEVLIITTGGTIASQSNTPIIQGSELIQAVPELSDYANIEVEEFARIGSYDMTPEHWLKLVKRIKVILDEKRDLTCIIVTHGTDSLEETAFFLNLTHLSSTPVVLVGSMRYSNEISADGPANLIDAVRVGICRESIGKGVLVVMNNNISAARDLVKKHNRRIDAFPPTELGYLGSVDDEKVLFHHSPSKPHTFQSDFNIYRIESLPKVEILQDFTGLHPSILTYFIGRPIDGLVISTMAGGRYSFGLAGMVKLGEEHKPIAISSRISSGRIMGSHSTSYPGSPIVVANDLPPNKARILLMLTLTKTRNASQIQDYFERY